ncbi:helix-turn-helix domain-containing protein [Ectopseudomonas guguanensis]|jgi:transcriptional regulator with XRE-family HTH domain|uniref:Helix-turn-helix n=1 Tax=Ectopseudomonas guguanensis TaxID=1198456 RepID=A0A1H0XGN3_9GAMM|nr:helix-turn-helix transcriptional regulator [Pseudomonas guguanensis]SDQ01955.1 Helix-turn-helix [Pseudomonas guguanensis]
MNILERNRVLNELQQQLASGEITMGAAVRRLRKEVTGLQQARFAQMCKLSVRALRQLELDEGNPTLQTLNSVFNPFGMQVGIVPKVPRSNGR